MDTVWTILKLIALVLFVNGSITIFGNRLAKSEGFPKTDARQIQPKDLKL